MLQPYLTPGGSQPQQAYMITHPNMQQQPMYPVSHQLYQQPPGGAYHMPVTSQHMHPVQARNHNMIGPTPHISGGPVSAGMVASNKHLHGYSLQQVPSSSLQKSLYSGSWTGAPLTQSPPSSGKSPASSYTAQGMHPHTPWNALPQNAVPNVTPPTSQGLPLQSSYSKSISQSYSPACIDGRSVADSSDTRDSSSFSHLAPPHLLSKTQSQNRPHAPSSFLSSTQSNYTVQTESEFQSQTPSSSLSQITPGYQPPTESSYQSQRLSFDIKSAYTQQMSDSASTASSRSSSPQRSGASSVQSKSSLTTVEAVGDRCTSSPPIAPHPFAAWKSDDPEVMQDIVQTEESFEMETTVDKLFQSRASSHGIQISAPGSFSDQTALKKKNSKEVYHEKVKADRFMEIAMKRGIVVSVGESNKDSRDSQDSKDSQDFSSVSDYAYSSYSDSCVNSMSGDGDSKLTSAGTEVDSMDNADTKSLYSDSCSHSDGEGYLSDFASHFARMIIEDVCKELSDEPNTTSVSEPAISTLNAHAKVFTMKWSTDESVALNPESPEFKPSYFRQKEATQITDEIEESNFSSALFQHHTNSGVDVYIADQPEMDEIEREEEISQSESLMVDVGVNTKRTKYKDVDIQTPLAFEPRDVCVNTDEMCMSEGSEFYTPEIMLRTEGTNTPPVETKCQRIQVNIGVKTNSQGLQVGMAGLHKSCKSCAMKDMEIIKLQMQVCHLRAQMCISELQRQMTELQQSKLQLSSFFISSTGQDVQVASLIDYRIECLEDEITKTKLSLVKCIEYLQKGQPLTTLPTFEITIPTSTGNSVLVPKELKVFGQPETGSGHSPQSRKRTHKDCPSISPNKITTTNPAVERVSTRTLVEESLLELQRERKSKSAFSFSDDNAVSKGLTSLFRPDDNTDKSLLKYAPVSSNHARHPETSLTNVEKDSQYLISSKVSSPPEIVKHSQLKGINDLSCNYKDDSPAHGDLKTSLVLPCHTEDDKDTFLENLKPVQERKPTERDSVAVLKPEISADSQILLKSSVTVSDSSRHKSPEKYYKEQTPDRFDQSEPCIPNTSVKVPSISLSNQMKSHQSLSPPNPIPTLPYPLPSANVPPKSAVSCTETHLCQESVSETASDESSPSTELKVHLAQVTDVMVKETEELVSFTRNDLEKRAPPGFENSQGPLVADINDDIQECYVDTDELVKKARAVLENFNLNIGKNRLDNVNSPPKKLSTSPISAQSSATASPRTTSQATVTNSTLEVLTTGKSVAGTGEIVQVVEKSVSDSDTGISDLILCARKKLLESDTICDKIREKPLVVASHSDATSDKTEECDVSAPVAESHEEQTSSITPVSEPPPEEQQPPPVPLATHQSVPTSKPVTHQQLAGQINPNLYQTVLAQVAKAYPHLTSNPMMLHSVCLQQTMVLQSYMKGVPGNIPTAPPPATIQPQPPRLPGPDGAGDGQHVPSTGLQTAGVTSTLSQRPHPKPQPPTITSAPSVGSSWNPVALVNMMNARKGNEDERQQTGVLNPENTNPQSAFKFQAAASPSPHISSAITRNVSDTQNVPSGLKDYILKNRNTNALEEPKQQTVTPRETNPFEVTASQPVAPKVSSQKKRPTKMKPAGGKMSPSPTTPSRFFPTAKATKIVMDEDWEDDCDKYPTEFTCTQDLKAPVYFRPIEPAENRVTERSRNLSLPQTSTSGIESGLGTDSFQSRSKNMSVKSDQSQNSSRSNTPVEEYQVTLGRTSQSKAAAFSRSLSNSSVDSKPESRKTSYTGLDDFDEFGAKKEAKPNRPCKNFLGRLLQNTVNSNEKAEREKEVRIMNTTPDTEKQEEEEENWQTVAMKKRKRDQARAEQLPSMALLPATKAPTKTARNNFDKLVDHLEKVFPNFSRNDIKDLIQTVRYQRGGALTGMKMNDIVESARLIVQQKFQSKVLSDSLCKKPPACVQKSTGNIYCTPEFQKHFEITKSVLPHRPAVQSPGVSSNDEDVCPICFEDFTHSKKQTLDCGHEFHVSCIREWVLKHERTCPTCRRLTLFQEEFPRLK